MSERLVYQEVYRKHAHTSVINAMVLSHDGHQLVTGSDDSTVLVWSTRNGSTLLHIKTHSPVLSLAWVGNSSRFIFGCESGRLGSVDLNDKVWYTKPVDSASGGHNAAISCVSPMFNDVFPISAAGEDIKVWRRTRHWQSRLAELQAESWYLKTKLASPVMVYHHDRKVEITSVNWEGEDAAASASHILVSYRWHGIMCWDVATKSVLWRLPMEECGTLSISPDTKFAATFGLSKAFEVRELRSGAVQRLQWQGPIIPAPESHHVGNVKMKEAQDKPVKDKPVCFVHESFAVAGAAGGNKAHVWDAERGDELLSLDHGDGSRVHSLAATYLHEEDKSLILTGTEIYGQNYIFAWVTVPHNGTTPTVARAAVQRIELSLTLGRGFWVNILIIVSSVILLSWW